LLERPGSTTTKRVGGIKNGGETTSDDERKEVSAEHLGRERNKIHYNRLPRRPRGVTTRYKTNDRGAGEKRKNTPWKKGEEKKKRV